MSAFSDWTGVNWDINQSVSNVITRPFQIVGDIFKGENIGAVLNREIKESFGDVIHLSGFGVVGDDQRVNALFRNKGLNDLTFGIFNDAASVGTIGSKLSRDVDPTSAEWGEAARFGIKAATVGAGVHYLGTPATLKDGLTTYGQSLVASKAIERGDYLSALAPAIDSYLPDLPEIPDEIKKPAEDLWNAINRPPQENNPWRWNGEPVATGPESSGAGSALPSTLVLLAIGLGVALVLKGRR